VENYEKIVIDVPFLLNIESDLFMEILMSSSIKPSSIQGIAWMPGLQAIKESGNCSSFEELRGHLLQNAPQNSEETRKKYDSLIIMRLFPERSMDGINPLVWR
jgi:hypothetical protein